MRLPKEYTEFIAKVCELSGCLKTDIKSKSRKREIVRARQIIISYRHVVMKLTQVKSTAPFGMKHSCAVHCVKVVKNDYHSNKDYRERFTEILEKYPILIQQ